MKISLLLLTGLFSVTILYSRTPAPGEILGTVPLDHAAAAALEGKLAKTRISEDAANFIKAKTTRLAQKQLNKSIEQCFLAHEAWVETSKKDSSAEKLKVPCDKGEKSAKCGGFSLEQCLIDASQSILPTMELKPVLSCSKDNVGNENAKFPKEKESLEKIDTEIEKVSNEISSLKKELEVAKKRGLVKAQLDDAFKRLNMLQKIRARLIEQEDSSKFETKPVPKE